jgi:DNA polymerase-1
LTPPRRLTSFAKASSIPIEAPPAQPTPRTPSPAPEAQPYTRTLFAQLARPFIIPASGHSEGLHLIFDLESDGLLDTVTRVHCIVIADPDSDCVHEYGPSQITDALVHLARADGLIGHNIQNYDLPVLHKLLGWAPRSECRIVDTLIAARLILPHLANIDAEVAARAKDAAFGQVHGKYSLEAWGVRLGMPKIGAELNDWSQWTPELQARCVSDVAICKRLWQFLQPDGYCRAARDLAHRSAAICNQITVDGVPFDTAAAEQLREQWQTRRVVLETRLRELFPDVNNFNSRIQIARVLETRGWQPERRTKKSGQPVIDDALLESLPAIYPECEGLAEHYILGRRLGQLATGAQAWIGNVHSDGRIHGGLIHIGTPHSRAKDLQPNMAQVPNHKKGVPFAAECRALFRHPGDWVFVTCDQSNLQDRAFAHYLTAHDGGAYAQTFADGIDQHWQTAIALGLIAEGVVRDKDNKVHTAIREGAKTFRYAFLFGAGSLRAGQIIAHIVRAVTTIAPEHPLCRQFWGGNKHPSEAALRQTGERALDRFLAATLGLRALRASLSERHRRRGWVEGLDGRRIPTAADYKVLNRSVTAAEAVPAKHAEISEGFGSVGESNAQQELTFAVASAVNNPPPPPPQEPESPPDDPPPRGNGRGGGNGYDDNYHGGNSAQRIDGSKTEAEHDTYAEEHAGEPFNDAFLLMQGYRLAHVFDYTLPDATLINKQNRYELRHGIAPTRKRPRKRFLPHRIIDGKDILGAGDRRVIFNWSAIIRAGPGSTVVVTEGESNAKVLIENGLAGNHSAQPQMDARMYSGTN